MNVTKCADGGAVSSAGTNNIVTTATVPAGSTILVFLSWYDTPAIHEFVGISDAGGAYSIDSRGVVTNNQPSALVARRYAGSQLNSGSTITVTFSGFVTGPLAWSAVYVDTPLIVDGSNTAHTTGTNQTTLAVGSLTSSQASSLYAGCYGVVVGSSVSATPVGSAVEVADHYQGVNCYHWSGYILESSAQSDVVSCTLSGAGTSWAGADAVYVIPGPPPPGMIGEFDPILNPLGEF